MTLGDDMPRAEGASAGHEGAILRLLERPLSDADLAAGAEWAARPGIVREGPTIGLLLFRLGDETCALPAKLLQRVTPWARPTPIPHRSTAVIRGLCNIRGELVLCANLHRLLGVQGGPPDIARPAQATDARRMVVVGFKDAPWVCEVDSLVGIERMATAELKPPPVTVEYAMTAYTLGVTEIRGQRVTVLDGERVLAGFQAGLS